MADAHPSACVDAGARLAADVRVGAHVVIEDDVEVGSRALLRAGTVLHRGSRIGAGCRLGPYAVLGGEPMDHDFDGESSRVVLEEGVEMREFATVHRATGEDAETRVGAGTLLMCYVHVSHNVRVGAGVTLTNAVQLGGHSAVGANAVLGAGALLHQFTRIGRHAMLGAASAANRDVLPFTLARGNVAVHYRLNRVGLTRHGIDGERYAALEGALRALRRRDEAALAALAERWPDVADLRTFVGESRRGVARFRGA